jgi:hypothetical protein
MAAGRARRAVARAVVAAVALGVLPAMVGQAVRGPYARGAGRDWLAGAAVLGMVAGYMWAFDAAALENFLSDRSEKLERRPAGG